MSVTKSDDIDIGGPAASDRFYYYRDHEVSGAWGVGDRETGKKIAIGMDKNDALAFAVFMSGREASAAYSRDDFYRYTLHVCVGAAHVFEFGKTECNCRQKTRVLRAS